MSVPHYLELSGDAHTRGRIHGGELRREVTACVDFYLSIMGLDEALLQQRAALFESLIESYSPSQAQEIRGIAEGAGLPVAHLFAINARSELVPFSTGECTVLCSPDQGVLAQTWDWCEQLQELITLLTITREDGHRVLTVTEPGIVGKIGLSSEGMGVCLNFLSVARRTDGVPIHNLLREALEAKSLQDARRRLREAGPGRGGNIMMLDAAGEAVDFEFAGDHVQEHSLPESSCHTNHCLYSDIPAGDLEANSKARITRARELMGRSECLGVEEMKKILSDREDEEAPICAPYQPLFGLSVGTLCTVVMDLPNRELHYRQGSDPEAAFQVYSLPGAVV